MMQQWHGELRVENQGRGLYEITAEIAAWVGSMGLHDGLLTVFIPHTSASLLIQENYDPDVRTDLERFLGDLVPDGDGRYVHRNEGPDDMPAHVRAALTQTQVAIPVRGGVLQLGPWQGIYLWEHRHDAHQRRILLHLAGE